MAGKVTPSRRAAGIAFLVLTAAVSFAGEPILAANVLSCPLSESGDSVLLAVNDPARGVVWGLKVDGILFFPPVDLPVGGREVVCLEASPDGKWVAVTAVSEGHTVFSIFPAAELAGMPLDGPRKVLRPACGYDAYPANVFFECWEGEWALVRIDGDEGDGGSVFRRIRPPEGMTADSGGMDRHAPRTELRYNAGE